MESATIQSTEEEADSVNIGTCPRPTVRGGRKGIQTPSAAAEASQQFCFGMEIRSPGAQYLYSFSYGVRSWPGTGAAKGREGRLPPEPDQRRGNCAPAGPEGSQNEQLFSPTSTCKLLGSRPGPAPFPAYKAASYIPASQPPSPTGPWPVPSPRAPLPSLYPSLWEEEVNLGPLGAGNQKTANGNDGSKTQGLALLPLLPQLCHKVTVNFKW